MSKINGDKARQNLRDRKQAKMPVKNKTLKADLNTRKTMNTSRGSTAPDTSL